MLGVLTGMSLLLVPQRTELGNNMFILLTHPCMHTFISLYNKNHEFILLPSIPVQHHKIHSNFSPILICNFFSE